MAAGDGLGIHVFSVDQRAGRGQRIIAARPDADQAVFRLQHVARAGQDQRDRRVRHGHHGFKTAQVAVGPPIFSEFDTSARELRWILFEFGFEAFEQGERIGGRAGKADNHLAVGDAPHFGRV